ncbi:MAG: hypothetical protein JXM73_25350 [Anaerolineae bacterium]|nr:hypothetical protein [Anaerolineae bacterium]
MGLDLWFRDDVLRILAGTMEGVSNGLDANPAVDAEYAAAYRQGFTDAVKTVAVSFGLVDRITNKVLHWRPGRLQDW